MSKKRAFNILVSLCWLGACTTGGNPEGTDLNQRVAELENEVATLKEEFTPGLAVLMNQNHGYLLKLNQALEQENWEYAAFCVHEMEEIFESIRTLHNNHDELVQPIDVQFKAFVDPVFGQLENAVKSKNLEDSKKLYIQLKNNCSSCHTANNHGFIAL